MLPNFQVWQIVRSYDEFVAELNGNHYFLTNGPRHISFDHDLGFGHGIPDWKAKTGYDCAMYLIQHCIEKDWPLPNYTIHSLNPVGAKRIAEAMKDLNRYKDIVREPN